MNLNSVSYTHLDVYKRQNQYIIHSMKKSHKRQYTYDEIIKEFILFADADAEEIGKAVIESFMESERYYNMG